MVLGPILLLIGINLLGMGLFQGVQSDLRYAIWDIMAILSQRIEEEEDSKDIE